MCDVVREMMIVFRYSLSGTCTTVTTIIITQSSKFPDLICVCVTCMVWFVHIMIITMYAAPVL